MVRGASGLAETYGVPPLVIGLTVVAFGTSAPELVVSIMGALRGETELAFGNIAGSNIANIALVLGTCAVIFPIAIEGQIIRRELPLLLLATTVLLVMTLDPFLTASQSLLDRSDAVVMLLLFGIFVYITSMDFFQQRLDPLATTINNLPLSSHSERRTNWILVGVGVVGLAWGGQLTIDHGVALAASLGVPEVIIGLLVVAVGTSMPELVTSVIAGFRREADLAVGNVIGSNIFNSMFVLPIGALVQPLAIPPGGELDIFIALLLGAALILIFFLGRSVMSRSVGGVLLISYFTYMTLRVSLS